MLLDGLYYLVRTGSAIHTGASDVDVFRFKIREDALQRVLLVETYVGILCLQSVPRAERPSRRTYVYRTPVASMDDETILDALSAIRLARQYSRHVYLLGHSLGAMLAPLIAERTEQPLAGVIMMAAPGRDMEAVVREQFDYLLPSGASPAFKEQQIENLRQRSPHYLQPQGQTDAARRLKPPMLILQGERDYQVTMQDFRLWQQALNGKPNVVFHSYPRLNHPFMEGEGKSTPLEYQLKGHVAPYVIDDISSFIH